MGGPHGHHPGENHIFSPWSLRRKANFLIWTRHDFFIPVDNETLFVIRPRFARVWIKHSVLRTKGVIRQNLEAKTDSIRPRTISTLFTSWWNSSDADLNKPVRWKMVEEVDTAHWNVSSWITCWKHSLRKRACDLWLPPLDENLTAGQVLEGRVRGGKQGSRLPYGRWVQKTLWFLLLSEKPNFHRAILKADFIDSNCNYLTEVFDAWNKYFEPFS